jgi:solute carrier family 25 phosphate transporter 23/24/25/41
MNQPTPVAKVTDGTGVEPMPASPTERLQYALAQPVTAAFIAGGVAGAVSRTVVSPLERLKIIFQVQTAGREEYKGSVGKALAKIWKEEGFKGMMRGNGTNCIRIVPYSAVQFGSYNFYKRVRIAPTCSDQCVVSYGDLLTIL